MSNRKAAFSAESHDRDILNTIPYYDEVYNQIADVVSVAFLNKAVSWLDVGCGTGKMAKVALEKEEIDYGSQFDVITSILVNHYLAYEERMIAVKNCYNALKEEGIYITFENFSPCDEIVKKLKKIIG